MKRNRQAEWCRNNPERRRTIRRRSYLKCKEKEKAQEARAANPERSRTACRKWYAENPEKARALMRKGSLRRRYGLTPTEYDEMSAAQGGACAICSGNRSARKCQLAVDHCHDTNVIRGLLCTNCNAGLGYFADSPKLLMAAIQYLARQAREVA